MGYDESFLRLTKSNMSKFINKVEEYDELFSTYGTQIYAHVKLLKPLKWGTGYTCGLEPFDLPVGEYIWVGGERRGHLYAMEDAPKDLKMNLCPVFVSNFDFDEIKRMQHDSDFAIITPLRDFDKLKEINNMKNQTKFIIEDASPINKETAIIDIGTSNVEVFEDTQYNEK